MATQNTQAFVCLSQSPDHPQTHIRLQNKVLYAPLAEIDPEVKNIIDKETWRQFTGLELIASEVRTTPVDPAIPRLIPQMTRT
jgi:hypothetical protein